MSKPDITLYWNIASQPARAVKCFLESKKVDYKEVHLDLFGGEHYKPEFRKVNPYGLVPALIVDGVCMHESSAMLRYLALKVPELNCFYEGTLEQRWQIDAMMAFNSVELRPGIYPKLQMMG
jgi:glutathione S-transferase